MILADTSIWVDHLRHGDAGLARLLLAGEIACHRFILGELACGGIRNRAQVLSQLSALPMLPDVSDLEVLTFVDQHQLMNKGLGLVDVHLLASCMLGGTPLWTRDADLRRAVLQLGLAPQDDLSA